MSIAAGGVLLLYHRPTRGQFIDASNVWENINAFRRHSAHRVWPVNIDLPPPPRLARLEFDAVVVHYSCFVPLDTRSGYLIPSEVVDYLSRSSAYKVATFQDEYHHVQRRFDFIDAAGIDCVYTMLEPPHDAAVYLENTEATRVEVNYPAYVGRELLDVADRYALPYDGRTRDIGYRGRPLPAYMGRGAQEKREIGERFAELAADSGLTMDIGVGEEDRIYGEDWHRFVASSRGTLGVESGVSCFDLRDEVREEWELFTVRTGGEPTIEHLERGALGRWDWKIPYFTVSPRNLEAAAFRVCQILYDGRYSGLMEPMRNYIPLKKDFSNLGEVLERFRDEALRREIAENAHADLIASGRLGYERLIAGFDGVLADAGVKPGSVGPLALAFRWNLRQPHPLTRKQRVIQRWEQLHATHPRLGWVAWALSRPAVVPYRLLQRLRRG